MTPAEVIAEVRKLIGDSRPTYRNSDANLLGFVNQAVKRVALLRPDLFSVFDEMNCVAGAVRQTAPADSLRLMEVLQVKNGNAVIETSREAMDQNYPVWPTVTAGAATTWMRNPRDPNKFFIFPKAPTGQVLALEYARAPVASVNATDTIGSLSDGYLPCVVDCVVFMVEAQSDSSVLSKRSEMFYKMFTDALGVTVQTKPVTDTETGGTSQKGG